MMTEQFDTEIANVLSKKKNDTCNDCMHQITCFIWRDFGKIIVTNMGEDKELYPVQPEHIAKICLLYREKGT